MIVMTTRSSTRVNPRRPLMREVMVRFSAASKQVPLYRKRGFFTRVPQEFCNACVIFELTYGDGPVWKRLCGSNLRAMMANADLTTRFS